MSKTIFLVALLVLGMCMAVSGSVTVTQFSDTTCTTQSGTQSVNTGSCIVLGPLSTQFTCGINGTTVQTSYADTSCSTAIGSPTTFQPNTCYPQSTTTAQKYACSSAWVYAPSVLILAIVSAFVSVVAKRGF